MKVELRAVRSVALKAASTAECLAGPRVDQRAEHSVVRWAASWAGWMAETKVAQKVARRAPQTAARSVD